MTTPKIKLIFSIYGESLKPQVFSEISKLQPTDFWLKGDLLPEHPNLIRKVPAYRKETAWELTIEDANTWNTDELVGRLMEKLAPQQEQIIQYIQNNELKSLVDVVVEIYGDRTPGISFTHEFMDLVVKMNGRIDCSIYVAD